MACGFDCRHLYWYGVDTCIAESCYPNFFLLQVTTPEAYSKFTPDLKSYYGGDRISEMKPAL